MAHVKGTPKTGGRAKGTPNKVTTDLRTWVAAFIESNLAQIEIDLKAIDPKDRIMTLEKFMQYVIPKQQSVNADAQIQSEYVYLERLLETAPDDAINAITDRILNLKEISNGRKKKEN
jgi:hypothetical protein